MATTDADLYELHSERALVAEARAGSARAFDELYRRHATNAWRLALAITRNDHDAGDVVAESMANVFTAIRSGRYSPEAPFRPYLLTTVRNASIDLHRRRRNETLTDDDRLLDLRSTANPTLDSIEAGEDADLIAEAYANLPERWRTVLWLTEVEELKPADVAPIIGLSPNATSQLAVRARRGLREQYLQAHVGPDVDAYCKRAVNRLGSYVAGTLPELETEKLERHLALCDTCTARRDELEHVGSRLRTLTLPIPAALLETSRFGWAAVIAQESVTSSHSGSLAEKALAGVSAAAAVIGVFGAAIVGFGGGDAGKELAAPARTELVVPDPIADLPLADLDLGSGAAQRTSEPVDASLTGSAPAVVVPTSAGTSTDDDATQSEIPIVSLPPATVAPPATVPGVTPPAPVTPPTTPTDTDDEGDDGALAPIVVAVEVADTPVEVVVGEDPSVTVGDIQLGGTGATDAGSIVEDTASTIGGLAGGLGLGG